MPDFEKGKGLLPAVVQDFASGKVLMLAYVDRTAWYKTLETGEAHYWSRSRNELWHKGATSGHVQKIMEIYLDCDSDTILFKVEQLGGAACHTGYESCFHTRIGRDGGATVVGERVFDPEKVYKR